MFIWGWGRGLVVRVFVFLSVCLLAPITTQNTILDPSPTQWSVSPNPMSPLNPSITQSEDKLPSIFLSHSLSDCFLSPWHRGYSPPHWGWSAEQRWGWPRRFSWGPRSHRTLPASHPGSPTDESSQPVFSERYSLCYWSCLGWKWNTRRVCQGQLLSG